MRVVIPCCLPGRSQRGCLVWSVVTRRRAELDHRKRFGQRDYSLTGSAPLLRLEKSNETSEQSFQLHFLCTVEHSSHRSILSSMELPHSTSPLHHQASQNVIAAPRSRKAKHFARDVPCLLHAEGGLGPPGVGWLAKQIMGSELFFFQMTHLKLRQ